MRLDADSGISSETASENGVTVTSETGSAPPAVVGNSWATCFWILADSSSQNRFIPTESTSQLERPAPDSDRIFRK